LRGNPTWRQFNPSDSPIMILALTSDTLTRSQLYDSANTVIQQQLSQISGVGQITLGGAALPSVRIELEPDKLSSYGIGNGGRAGRGGGRQRRRAKAISTRATDASRSPPTTRRRWRRTTRIS